MSLKTPVKDRVSTFPGRVTLTPVSGATNTYDMVRADSPLEEGTPINKALFDQKAYCLTGSVTVYVSKAGSDDTGTGSSTAPYASIQKAIDSLPKLLEGYFAIISIADGTYEERLDLDGFQGGILEIGVAGRNVVVRGVEIGTCSLVRLRVSITRSATLGGTPLVVRNGSHVVLGSDLVINGALGGTSGITVESGSHVTVPVDLFGYTKTTVNNCSYIAVYATDGSTVALGEIAGSGNTTGLHAANGSVITYGARSLTATTANVTASGGRIYSGAQSSIPNY